MESTHKGAGTNGIEIVIEWDIYTCCWIDTKDRGIIMFIVTELSV